jgi:CheY-like chemotaxis protein
MDGPKLLIVEDESEVARTLELKLKKFGYTVVGSERSAEKGIEKAGELHPDIVLMEIELSGSIDGIQAADAIRKKYQIPSIYITALCDAKTLQRVGASIPYGYILKPFNDDELRTVIDIAFEVITKKE